MQLTTQQKIVSAVLGLAVAAFGVDRWVIGTDAADDAAVASAAQQPRAARRVTPRPTTPARASAAEASFGAVTALTQRLESVARAHHIDVENTPDAFVPAAAWVGPPRVALVEEHPDAAREFVKVHRLMAVMKQQGGGVAIIEGKTVAVGQSIGGFRLVVVKDKSAVLRRGNQRVELRLPEDATASTSEKPLGVD